MPIFVGVVVQAAFSSKPQAEHVYKKRKKVHRRQRPHLPLNTANPEFIKPLEGMQNKLYLVFGGFSPRGVPRKYKFYFKTLDRNLFLVYNIKCYITLVIQR